MQTDTLALLLSNPKAIGRPGGDVINVQMVTCTAGLLGWLKEATALAARNAQEGICACTTPWPLRAPWLLQSGTQPATHSAQKMRQPQAAGQLSGSVNPAAMYGLHASFSGLPEELDAQC